ncbi:DoxX-like family protein [Lacinutrix undariae]
MKKRTTYKISIYGISIVWVINGLFCKILNFTPRHEAIIKRITESEFSREFAIIIGVSEIIMALWIISQYKSKINAITQIVIVATMNVIEYILAPDLLLWGEWNIVFAFLFITLVYFTNFNNTQTNVRIS